MSFVQNFLSSSLHLRNAALVSKVWEAISAEIHTEVRSYLCTACCVIHIEILELFLSNV